MRRAYHFYRHRQSIIDNSGLIAYRYYQSSSCGTRSGVACYQVANKWTFPTSFLRSGDNATNEIVLSLPYNATDIYVQYDALRLEVQ